MGKLKGETETGVAMTGGWGGSWQYGDCYGNRHPTVFSIQSGCEGYLRTCSDERNRTRTS